MTGEGTGQPAGGAPAGEGTPAGTPAGGAEHPATVQAPWSGVEGVYTLGEGENAQPWWAGIQEEPIREYMEAKQYANPEEAARAAWNANKLLQGKDDAVTLPNENSSPEDWNALYSKLGRPDKAADYEFKFDDSVKVNEQVMEFGKELFHELGASPAKAQAAADKWNAFQAEIEAAYIQQEREANDAALNALTAKWESEQKLNEMQAAGKRVVEALGLSTDAIQAIEASIGSAPLVELLAMIGSKSPEGTFKASGSGSGDPNDPANMTSEQAQATITKLQADEKFQEAYTNKQHPEHGAALKRMEALFAKASK